MKRKHFFSLSMLVVFSILSTAFTLTANSQELLETISESFKKGNSAGIAKHFNPSIELEILNEENIYSKAQAELLLKDFFSRNKPTSFRVNHQGTKGVTSFAIGTLVANTGSFRVSLFMKKNNDKLLIHQLRIERSDNVSRRQ